MKNNILNENFFIRKANPDKKHLLSPTIAQYLNNFDASKSFHSLLEEYIPSPVYSLKNLAGNLDLNNIHIKNEGERFGISALKMLGASFAMHILLEHDTSIKGFCTATDGNHGRSVAWFARYLKKPAIVFVPSYTIEERIQNIRNEGADVITIKGNYDDAVAAAKDFASNKNMVLVQDMAWEGYKEIPALIMAGYYTQMQEIIQQLDLRESPVDLIFLQSGNGSWPAAITNFIRNHPHFSDAKILLVEPVNSDCMLQSLKTGKLSQTEKSQQTIMAGLNCGTPSSLAYPIIATGIDAAIGIEDSYALDAIKLLYQPRGNDRQIEAGESGAAGLAGLLAVQTNPDFEPVKTHLGLNEKSTVLLFNTEGVTNHLLMQELFS